MNAFGCKLLGMTSSSGLGWDGEQRLLAHSIWTGNSFVTYTWVYDPTASIPAMIQEFSSSGRNVVYIREPDGSLVARFEPGENPVADYYYFDGLGSTVMLTEGLSTVTDRYDYDAWGNEYPIMVSTADNPYRYVGQLGYYTHWMDSSLTDLLHLGVRFYEPGVGRFGQIDEINIHLWSGYSYSNNMPLSAIDPDGRKAVSPNDPRFPMQPCHGAFPAACHWRCISNAVQEAYRILRRHFPEEKVGEINGPQDAFRHCVWACLVRTNCGAGAYNSAVIDHENGNCWYGGGIDPKTLAIRPGRWDPVGSPMDLANNEMGRKCSTGVGASCESCCVDAFHRGDLYILPRKYWTR